MSAVAEIEAAIAKLREQRDVSSGVTWWSWHSTGPMAGNCVETDTDDPDNPDVVVEGGWDDVELIVTLHRTIDAQLAILRIGLNAYTEYISDIRRALDHDRAALALARAINNTA